MKDQPTQTTPKGYEIPIPKRSAFDRTLRKAANTDVPPEEPKKKPLRRRLRRPKK